MDEKFFKDPRLPFIEVRYSTGSNRIFKPHLHQTLSVGAVDKGEVRYSLAGKVESLLPGSLVLINPEVLHSCNPASADGRSYYMLHLDIDWCLKIQKTLWPVESFVEVDKTHLDARSFYEAYVLLMQLLMDKKRPLLFKEQTLVEFVAELFLLACNSREEEKPSSVGIGMLKSHLAGNLREELTLHSLAEQLEANPYTLLRRFKVETGVTPHAYRMNCRVEKARHLLQGGMGIAETAVECGFYDQSHLHRHFKAMTSVTPKEYRVNFVQ